MFLLSQEMFIVYLLGIKSLYLFSFQPFIDRRLASLTGSFFKQSIFKQILTEGILVCV